MAIIEFIVTAAYTTSGEFLAFLARKYFTVETRVVYWGMGINLACMVLLIMIAVVLQAPGAQAAITALTLSFVSEMLFLRRAMQSVACGVRSAE